MNNDYARHVHRTWVNTHSHSIRTDPEIYLPGECEEEGEESDMYDSDEDEDELSDVFAGMKRKAAINTGDLFPMKVAKTMARAASSTAALNVTDDRHPDLTLVDAPIDESVPPHPYGRHSCLYMEVKMEANKKPNPQEVVCPLFLESVTTKAILDRQRRRQATTTKTNSKMLKTH